MAAGCWCQRTRDKGQAWVLNGAFPSRKVRCLLAHEGKLYAGTDAEGVVVSSDGGHIWTPLQQEFPGIDFQNLLSRVPIS